MHDLKRQLLTAETMREVFVHRQILLDDKKEFNLEK